jgi:hypothetical protein
MTTDNEAFLKEQLKYCRMASEDMRFPKKWREGQLRMARTIERQLGIEGEDYNG